MPKTQETLVQGAFPFREEVPVKYGSSFEQGSRDPDRYGRELTPEQQLAIRIALARPADTEPEA